MSTRIMNKLTICREVVRLLLMNSKGGQKVNAFRSPFVNINSLLIDGFTPILFCKTIEAVKSFGIGYL